MGIYTNKILIFDDLLTGHHLEYIHHLYTKAVENKNIQFIFVLPREFDTIKKQLNWPDANNTSFHLIEKTYSKISILDIIIKCFVIKKIATDYQVNKIFLVYLMKLMPYMSFLIPRKFNISGIIYDIYIYSWKNYTKKEKSKSFINYLFYVKFRKFDKIYLLNDDFAPKYLNRKFKIDKFRFLPDPIINLNLKSKPENVRIKLGIPENYTVYLHFGGLSKRKGSLEILEAIELTKSENLINKCFIFAGKIYGDIRNEFHHKISFLKDKTLILCFDYFCEYSFLGDLCSISNFIILPYENSGQSSGVVNYAALFNVPAVVPKYNLLGKIVNRNNLGYILDSNKAKDIKKFIENDYKFNYLPNERTYKYLKERSIENFNETIFSDILK